MEWPQVLGQLVGFSLMNGQVALPPRKWQTGVIPEGVAVMVSWSVLENLASWKEHSQAVVFQITAGAVLLSEISVPSCEYEDDSFLGYSAV
jgi:hypothetical protein